MLITLRRAREQLAESTNAYGQKDVRALVNRAIVSLAGMKGWERLRKVLRFPCIGPRFTLPQGCASLVRMCVNGRPATVRAQDFSFIHSGPGDVVRPPSGFAPVGASNVVDAGTEPVMFEPPAPCQLGAWSPVGDPGSSDSGAKAPAVHLKCIGPDGRIFSLSLPVHRDPEYDASGNRTAGVPFSSETDPDDGETVTWAVPLVQCVAEAVLDLPEDYGEYVTLYAKDYSSGRIYPLACWNPEVEVPTFRHYDIAGVRPGQPIEVLAEVRLDPLPLVRDTDTLPFDSIGPVEWVIRGDWYMKSNEPDTAQKYYAMAAQWLQSQEVVEATMQTSLVVNSHFVNSPGEVSLDAYNI